MNWLYVPGMILAPRLTIFIGICHLAYVFIP